MIQIRLPREEWEYDPESPLGQPGGFGAVFIGAGERHKPVAIKKLHPEAIDKAHRELRIADELVGRSLEHVVPVLDAGKDEESGSYFVVMALAEKSLQQEIGRIGVFTDEKTIRVLLDIALGLAEVQEIVHRDLKPANILYHEGRWKVADFGIARFVEESTSLETLRGFLSAPYAAPEQWRLERATSATDIYALGCIAYALLTGAPPFRGPRREDYRHQHLYKDPPPFTEGQPRLRTLLVTMLRKEPKGRPGLDRAIRILNDIAVGESREARGKGFSALAQAGAVDAETAAHVEAAQIENQARRQVRKQLADSGFRILHTVTEVLFERITEVLPTAERFEDQFYRPRLLKFGSASLEIDLVNGGYPITEDAFQRSGWDVIAGATIRVVQSKPESHKWSANLWYTNLGHSDEYRWWEVPYMTHALVPSGTRCQPFALNDLSEADLAAASGMHAIALAAEPRPIDDENIDDFCDRWAALLAKAYYGQLKNPSSLPLT